MHFFMCCQIKQNKNFMHIVHKGEKRLEARLIKTVTRHKALILKWDVGYQTLLQNPLGYRRRWMLGWHVGTPILNNGRVIVGGSIGVAAHPSTD